MRRAHALAVLALVACKGDPVDSSAPPARVSVTFEGVVATITDAPLGFDETLLQAPVHASMAYDQATPDSLWNDPDRGRYEHTGTGLLSLEIDGHYLVGSGNGTVEIANTAVDTFRFVDGQQRSSDTDHLMTLDFEPAPLVEVWLSLVDDAGTTLTSDALPDPFPFVDLPYYDRSFAVSEPAGTLLIGLTSVSLED